MPFNHGIYQEHAKDLAERTVKSMTPNQLYEARRPFLRLPFLRKLWWIISPAFDGRYYHDLRRLAHQHLAETDPAYQGYLRQLWAEKTFLDKKRR